MNEVFGNDYFRNEIIWHYENKLGTGWGAKTFDTRHDVLLKFSKGKRYIHNEITEAVKEHKIQPVTQKIDGKRVWLRNDDGTLKYAMGNTKRPVGDVWTIPIINPVASERLDYPTQKPEKLAERIILSGSNPGDLVADFFCGSGTTASVAEKLGRKWIATDLGKFGIHTTLKDLIGVQRELKATGKDFRAFEVLNLGRYERQAYLNIGGNLTEKKRETVLACKEREFRELILRAYRATALQGEGFFHGQQNGRLVVGPINLPVGRLFIEEVITECRKRGASRADILAFEFEMGLFPAVLDEAKGKGIDLAPRTIPPEVFDKRAVDKGQVRFADVAYIAATPRYDKQNPSPSPSS